MLYIIPYFLSLLFQERAKIPKAEYHELVGKCYLRSDEANLAIESFLDALKITPQNEEVRVLLVEALFTSGRYSEAVDSECPQLLMGDVPIVDQNFEAINT